MKMNREEAKDILNFDTGQLILIDKLHSTAYYDNLECIRAFAEGKNIEVEDYDGKWKINPDPGFYRANEYRIQKQMRRINGFEVPMGLKEISTPTRNTFYVAVPASRTFFTAFGISSLDTVALERGLVFDNKEDAIATAKAMLGIDPYLVKVEVEFPDDDRPSHTHIGANHE